jgi:hypothetical protein
MPLHQALSHVASVELDEDLAKRLLTKELTTGGVRVRAGRLL